MQLLVVNAGSTSVKGSVLEVGGPIENLRTWSVGGLGTGGESPSVAEAACDVLDQALTAFPDLVGVLHRVVHGGTRPGPAMVDDHLVAELASLAPLAPLHQPVALTVIAAARRAAPQLPQLACFDTSFFAGLPEAAWRITVGVHDPLVRKYGFHGLAYTDVVFRLGEAAKGRMLLAHLGGGMSMVALHDGEPIDTTMGMTPLGGLPMASRSGDLDPGIVLFLLRSGKDPAVVGDILSHSSGLSSLGVPADMKSLEDLADRDPRAALALAILDRRLLMQAGAYAALLGGLDAIAFSGGVGEHDARLREALVSGLRRLGLTPEVHVVGVREDHAMARVGAPLLGWTPSDH